MRLKPEDHASALAARRWKGISAKGRQALLARVRAAKKRKPRASDAFLTANEILRMSNAQARER
jgi:hypothetical protein